MNVWEDENFMNFQCFFLNIFQKFKSLKVMFYRSEYNNDSFQTFIIFYYKIKYFCETNTHTNTHTHINSIIKRKTTKAE